MNQTSILAALVASVAVTILAGAWREYRVANVRDARLLLALGVLSAAAAIGTAAFA